MPCPTCLQIESDLKKRRITKEDYVRKLSLHKYEEKQVELKAETSQLAAQLDSLRKGMSEAHSIIIPLQKEKELLEKELISGYKEVARLDGIMSTHGERLKHINRQIDERLSFSDIKLKQHEAAIGDLSVKIVDKVKLLAEMDIMELALATLHGERDELILEIGQLQGRRYDMEQYMAKEYIKLETGKIDVNQLIEKHGKILTKTEQNLAKIELYVRRLQRYYDEHSINLNILPIFNIPKL